MLYRPNHDDLLTVITYGSYLYGTSTPTSDHDFKAVYLPAMRDLILAKSPRVLRYRYDADGNPISESQSMPDNGYEAEHVPVQKFVHDYLGGQAYAVETVFAVVQGAHAEHMDPPGTQGSKLFCAFEGLCYTLAKLYVHRNVNGMVGFAVKQTFDYVRRGERYTAAQNVLRVVDALMVELDVWKNTVRLDTAYKAGTVLDEIVEITGLDIGSTRNHDKIMRTLKLNGREYLETTTLEHFRNAVQKLVDQYGERSTRASETEVDWKSLSHAVRVYEQVIELLTTETVTFPRPNADDLRQIKNGEIALEDVKNRLAELDDRVNELLEVSELPEVDDKLRAEVENVLYEWLRRLY